MKQKINICLILQDKFNPDFPAKPEIVEVYGNFLPLRGHEITWILTSSNSEEKKVNKYKTVHLYTVKKYQKDSLPLKLYYRLKHYYNKYRLLDELFKNNNYDLIQSRNGIFDSILALLIKKKYNVPFIFQYSFPKGAFRFLDQKKVHTIMFGEIEEFFLKIILKKADFIFPISEWMAKGLVNEGIPASKMMPFPMGINGSSFVPSDGNDIKDKYNLYGKTVFVYSGSLDRMRNLEIIIRAFAGVVSKDKKTVLMMVGDGNGKSGLEKLTTSLKIGNYVIFTGKVPYFDVHSYIASADICLSPIPPISLYSISSPTKLFEYMAMEKPVIANEGIYEHENVISKSNGGILVKYESNSFMEGMLNLLKYPAKTKQMGKYGREWVLKNRSYEIISEKIENKYYEILNNY